ncbi:DUF4062 domain-containing protein [Pseudomonas triticicola]|uniref:DUF4062 domain-containing protein n=1 Tax=Pseudomonas triticicola TaxID=2842345 RepID=UPI003EBA7578
MAKPRIFVSSTCYDLGMLRSELRPFITNMGYEPIMSDYSDILYDPRSHTHVSCINEVGNCDLLVLILGQRFGGAAIDAALECVNFEELSARSSNSAVFEGSPKFSITQLEVLKAIENSIPIYAFVDDKVYHDHLVYEKNKHDEDLVQRIKFPSMQKNETAKYVFEFINYLTHRVHNNCIVPFSRLEDIRSNLVSQWSQLYQRLLLEDRTRLSEIKRYQDFSERLEDLKTVVLASISTPDLRDIAKGAVQFRHLIAFICALQMKDHLKVLKKSATWEEMLKNARVVSEKITEAGTGLFKRSGVYLVLDDGTFYQCQYTVTHLENLKEAWKEFCKLQPKIRDAISEALIDEVEETRFSPVTYRAVPLERYLEELNEPKLAADNGPGIKW